MLSRREFVVHAAAGAAAAVLRPAPAAPGAAAAVLRPAPAAPVVNAGGVRVASSHVSAPYFTAHWRTSVDVTAELVAPPGARPVEWADAILQLIAPHAPGRQITAAHVTPVIDPPGLPSGEVRVWARVVLTEAATTPPAGVPAGAVGTVRVVTPPGAPAPVLRFESADGAWSVAGRASPFGTSVRYTERPFQDALNEVLIEAGRMVGGDVEVFAIELTAAQARVLAATAEYGDYAAAAQYVNEPPVRRVPIPGGGTLVPVLYGGHVVVVPDPAN